MIRDFTKFMGKRLKSTPNPENIFLGDNRIVIVPLEKAERVQADYAAYKRRLKTLNEGARNLQTYSVRSETTLERIYLVRTTISLQ